MNEVEEKFKSVFDLNLSTIITKEGDETTRSKYPKDGKSFKTSRSN